MEENCVPRKKPRLDPSTEDIWGPEEDFTDDVLAQADMVATQVYSQMAQIGEPSATNHHSSKSESKFQRHHSWTATPNENLPAQLLQTRSHNQMVANVRSICQPSKQKTSQLWTGSIQQEVERQKHELKCLKEEKLLFEERLKLLQEALSKKDIEIQVAKQESSLVKQQCAAEKHERQSQLLEIDRLKTELNFKCQELASQQYKVSHQLQQQRASTLSRSQVQRDIFKSPLKVVDDISGFPSSVSFSKRLPLKNTESSKIVPSRTDTVSEIEEDSRIKLRVPRLSGIESGPGLVDILLNETITWWPSTSTLVKYDTTLSCFTNKSKLTTNRLNAGGSTPKESQQINDDWNIALRLGIGRLLEDDGAVMQSENIQRLAIPEDLNIFKTFLGLRHDSANVLLPLIEDALKDGLVLDSCRPISNSESSLDTYAASSSASVTAGVKSASPSDPNFITLQGAGHGMPAELKESIQHTVTLLKVLNQLVSYSPGVRHYLIQGICSENPGPSRLETVSGSSDSDAQLPGPSHRQGVDCYSRLQSNYSKEMTSPCIIMKKLFTMCSLTYMEDLKSAELLQLTLEIFTTIAACCDISKLHQFLSIMKIDIVQNFTSLTCSGTIFIQFVSLLCVLCCSKNIIEATCNHEDFCLWIPLSDGWQKARQILPTKQMIRLDNLMIKLLSQCMTLDDVRPPFLAANECHCPFEIISNVILYLHKQQKLYETVGHLDNWPTLQKGIVLLYQIAHQDAHFRDHRVNMDAEMIAFIHWLPEIQKIHNLGPEADVLMEMWSIGSDTTSEIEETNN